MKIIDKSVYTFSRNNPPFCTAQPGEVLLFKTLDCFGGQFTSEEQLMDDLKNERTDSPIFRHHIDYVNGTSYPRDVPYEKTEPNQIIVDYIASMTDDYLIDLHRYLFPESKYYVPYTGYFDDLYTLRGKLEGQITIE